MLKIMSRRLSLKRIHGCTCLFPKPEIDAHEAVILIHGMGRTSLSMLSPALFLRKRGFTVILYGYPSTRHTIGKHAEGLLTFLRKIVEDDFGKVHFVTHSLGGIVARLALANIANPKIGRMVMTAPPNQGSVKANEVSRIPFASTLLRPLDELKNEKDSFIKTVPVPEIEIGVIAGLRDGKVQVAESHLEGEKAHLTVNSRHSFIMNRQDVKEAIYEFLRGGKFNN
ncbi:MAG: alpha/beta fold hydrolase [Victivallales bacterium]|jgi:pimeloyl-ACP methyl ester carboxylesterase